LETKFNRAVDHFQQGRVEQAEAALLEIQRASPDIPEVLHLLAVIALQTGHPDRAVPHLEKAISTVNDSAELYGLLGNALKRHGRPEDALPAFEKSVALQPGNAEAHYDLGNILRALQHEEEAITSYRKAISLRPDYGDAHYNLGLAFKRTGRIDAAIKQYEAVLTLKPDDAEALNNLGSAYLELSGDDTLAKALEALEHAVEAAPGLAIAHANLGKAYVLTGRAEEAVAETRKALELGIDRPPGAHSNLIFSLCYLPRVGNAELLAEAKRWNQAYAYEPDPMPHTNTADPLRPIRVGYVSADFKRHPGGYFFLPIAHNHDPDAVEAFCYFNSPAGDDLTAEIQAQRVTWRNISAMDDHAVADLVRRDEIDILVDLSGHSSGNRLPMFSLKPAPIQVTGVSIFCTSGVAAMDIIIGDRFETPDGVDADYSERLIRLADGVLCYQPPDYAPPVAPRPASRGGPVTFGSFNNLAKINPSVVMHWARILNQVAGSRLLLRNAAFSHEQTRERYLSDFEAQGVDRSLILLEGGAPHPQFLGYYGEIDIALDPFPYSGGLTTLEALWMGVPVITLPGETYPSRHSYSHLSVAGFGEWIAENADDYVKIATRLAMDPDALGAVSSGMRDKMAASPVCDGVRYTRNLETLYRDAWRDWCAQPGKSA